MVCRVVWHGFYPAVLVRIIAGCVILAGKSVVMALTSRPRETSDPGFLDSLLGVFGYPAGSGRLLLAGDLPLRYNSGCFAMRKPAWKLPGAEVEFLPWFLMGL